MGAFYRKYRRIFFGLICANALISLLQLYLAWSHLVRQEWWLMSFSIFFFAFNAVSGYSMYKSWCRTQQEEKDYMWRVLGQEVVDEWAV
jgi:hypothetical protein